MLEKYFYITAETARRLIDAAKDMTFAKRGIDRRAYLFDDYVVLSTGRLKLRNFDTHDDDYVYLDEIIGCLKRHNDKGVGTVPILGYVCEKDSIGGEGWMIQKRALGEELYDDAILTKFQMWAQNRQEELYLKCSLSEEEAADYLLKRTRYVSEIPQAHFDKFIRDMLIILADDILIDSNGKSNFFYDEQVGFQFIDLDAHNDYKYGLTDEKPDVCLIAVIKGFVPCHLAEGTVYFSGNALCENALGKLRDERIKQLKQYNREIFDKCRAAMLNNGITEEVIDIVLDKMKIYGADK